MDDSKKKFVTMQIPVHLIDYPDRDRPEADYGDMESLGRSIIANGLIHPISVDWDKSQEDVPPILIAGLRRLLVHKYLGIKKIPCRVYVGLTQLERDRVMHEENAHRKDLSWKAQAIAVFKYHESCIAEEGDSWTIQDTAKSLNYSSNSWRAVADRISVAKILLNKDHPLFSRISECAGVTGAQNILRSQTRRAIDQDLTDSLVEEYNSARGIEPRVTEENAAPGIPDGVGPTISSPTPEIRSYIRNGKHDVFNVDFHLWAKDYNGEAFNVIHLDPPYGVGMHESDQASSNTKNTYEDNPEDYWRFLNTLKENATRLISVQCHIVQWFSMNYYQPTIDFYQQWAKETERDIRINPFPLLWWKNDNTGMVPDALRYGRRVYETAFLISFGDRKVSTVQPNLFDAPSGAKSDRPHMSYKPENMLTFHLAPLVDDSVNFLDPCVGSGTSLAAAESLGARKVFGLELDGENHRIAIATLNRRRLIINGEEERARLATINQLNVAGE